MAGGDNLAARSRRLQLGAMSSFRAVLIGVLWGLMAAPAAFADISPGYESSTNWAGYQVQGEGVRFDDVSATWTETSSRCDRGLSPFYTWVGIGDPDGTRDAGTRLQQIGTAPTCGRGAPAGSFWENVPGPPHLITDPAYLGDRMHASVAYAGHELTLKLADLTRHWRFVKRMYVVAPDERAAEWIVEDAVAGTLGSPWADFSPVTFTDARLRSTTGASGTITSSPWVADRIALLGGRPPRLRAWPSAPFSDGSSFRVTST